MECAAFGLDHQSRSISAVFQFGTSVSGDRPECHRFLTGTCDFRLARNKIIMLEFRDDTRLIESTAEWSFESPVLDIACCRAAPLAAVVHRNSSAASRATSIMRLVPPSGTDSPANLIATLTQDVHGVAWSATPERLLCSTTAAVMIVDVQSLGSVKDAPTVPGVDVRGLCASTADPTASVVAAWDPHRADTAVAACGQELFRVDLSAKRAVPICARGHYGNVRALDFNPNKLNEFVTASDDGFLRFWDIRKADSADPCTATVALRAHDHACYAATYNHHSDELVLSCSADHSAKLWYEPISDAASTPKPTATTSAPKVLKKGLVKQFQDCGDAVYSVAWSSASPWVFAAVTYAGKVLVDSVPREYKMALLLDGA